jgi:surface antigen
MRGLSPVKYRGNLTRGEGVRSIRQLLLILCVSAGALATGGCSITFPMGSLLGESDKSNVDVTAALPSADQPSPLSPELTAEDWRRAKAAMAIALDPVGNGASAPWANPETDLRGEFVPASQPFVKNDEICRDFLAELVLQTGSQKLQGTACRPSGGEWSVVAVEPHKKGA